MKKPTPPINDATIAAYATGEEHAQFFIQHFPHYELDGDELFEFLSHYMKPQPEEVRNYLRGYLVRVQEELMRGAA
jgi:hypothetical protein